MEAGLAMISPVQRYSEEIYAAMRVVLGFLLACHGAQKFFGVLGGTVQLHTAKGLIAGTIELLGGTLIGIGLFTPVVAFIASGEMAVAYFWMHTKRGFWPIINKGELAVALCFAFLYISARRAGRYSLDHVLRRKLVPARSRQTVGQLTE
jgi:putative oxidoreductase